MRHFPEPEVLSIEPDLQFYDIKNGIFNSFSPTDLTNLNQEAKEHIKKNTGERVDGNRQKRSFAGRFGSGKIVETIGWTLDYSALEISNKEKQHIEE